MKNSKVQFYIVSPDGFPIQREQTHDTPKLAWQTFDAWKEGYSRQGHYSTIKNGERIRIHLEELREHCKLEKLGSS